MIVQHNVELISIGNGTASRETDKLAADVIKLIASKMPERKVSKIVVSEAGASVYSASAVAAAEFPEIDVSLRGAISIARRLQDPLAELVKIEPEVHRRRAVSARRKPARTGTLPRCDRGRLRQCSGRGCQYCLRSAPCAGVGAEHRAGEKHRGIPKYQRPVCQSKNNPQGAAPGRQDLRAGRRLSAHQRRRQSSGPFGGPSGSLSGGRAHSRASWQRHRSSHGTTGDAEGTFAERIHR